MEPKLRKSEPPVKPVRNSIKAIQSNIVNRRTQLFEGSPPREATGQTSSTTAEKNATVPVKSAPPNRPERPAPPKFHNPSDHKQPSNINAAITKEFAEKVALKKTASDTEQYGAHRSAVHVKGAVTAESSSDKPQPVPKPRPRKPDNKPILPAATDRERSVSDSAVPDLSKLRSHLKDRSETDRLSPGKPPTPMYSKIDKAKKLQDRQIAADHTVAQEEEDNVSSTGPPGPPSKPPRTFEHDDYLKRKALKKAMKHKSSHPASQSHVISGGLQEEPEEQTNGNTVFQTIQFRNRKSDLSTSDDSNSHLYEEIQDPNKPIEPEKHIYEEVGRRLSGNDLKSSPQKQDRPDRPHPPPRPPNPKVSTLSGHKSAIKQDNKPLKPAKPLTVNPHNQDKWVSKKSFNNPGYGKDPHEIIPIRTVIRSNDEPGKLKRSRSDEFLYDSKVDLNAGISEDPVYQDPMDVVKLPGRPHVHKGVVIDAEGYAVPHIAGAHTLGRHVSNQMFCYFTHVSLSTY